MNVLYFDEVKYEKGKQDGFWLGGIALPLAVVSEVESQVNLLSKEVFGDSRLSRTTEFHGKEIFQGKSWFKGKPFDYRLDILNKIMLIIMRSDIQRIYVKIQPENLVYTSDDPADIAFMYFVELADKIFEKMGGPGMLFGDYDEPRVGPTVMSLDRFKEDGTYWRKGTVITNVVDTVYFAQSHHSRMLQLADVFLYCLQLASAPASVSKTRTALRTLIEQHKLRLGCRNKVWPNQPVWFR